MSPRKKSKPNPKAPASGTANEPDSSTVLPPSNEPAVPEANEAAPRPPSRAPTTDTLATTNSAATSNSSLSRKDRNNNSERKWYGSGGSWRSKAPPVAQIAKESIGVTGGATSELVIEGANAIVNSPTKLLSRRSSKGDPIAASMTKLNVTSSSLVDRPEESQAVVDAPEDTPAETSLQAPTEAPKEPTVEALKETGPDPPLPPDPPKAGIVEKKDKTEAQGQSTNTLGWRSWWSRPDGYGAETNKTKGATKDVDTADAQETPLPGSTPLGDSADKAKTLGDNADGQAVAAETRVDKPMKQTEDSKDVTQTNGESGTNAYDKGTPSRSWLWLWSNTQNAQANPAPTQSTTQPPSQDTQESSETVDALTPNPAVTVTTPEAALPADNSTKTSTKPEPSKPSGWAFWSRDKPQSNETADPNSTHKQVGELAVADTPSQSTPEAVQFNEQESPPQKEPAKSIRSHPRPKDKSIKPSTPSKTSPACSPAPAAAAAAAAAAPQPAPKQASTSKQEPPNLILPGFRSTYHPAQKPSYWQQIQHYFLGGEPEAPHLYIAPSPPQIKKAIAIGVHGYFPAPLLQKVLGQPTGTSVRFANAAAAAIQEWTEARGYSAKIEKVALEGEGFIADRVSTLWKLLLNWIEHIKSADFILVACHSQGVPVAIMLVAKLIQFGCVNAARIGVCAMAGVNLGPFPEYRTRYLGGTAAELFEFSRPTSIVSQMYLGALEEVLQYGVRIVYIGSIDDQLVSLESSTFSNIAHPYIYRAVFVDGRIHAPDFITHLVGFALKLRNLGLPDHGLVRELSPALAGSLYSGEGHSRIYEDPKVYNLAISHALETTSLPIPPTSNRPVTSTGSGTSRDGGLAQGKSVDKATDTYALKVKDYETVGGGNQNPYFLPWAMRGLLEEEFVKRELGWEVEELLGLFETWKPVGKGLRDVRFRLEAVRSKL